MGKQILGRSWNHPRFPTHNLAIPAHERCSETRGFQTHFRPISDRNDISCTFLAHSHLAESILQLSGLDGTFFKVLYMLAAKQILQWLSHFWCGCLTTPVCLEDARCLKDFLTSVWSANEMWSLTVLRPVLPNERMPRPSARNTIWKTSRHMGVGRSMVCRLPQDLPVPFSFFKVKVGSLMWWNTLTPKVSRSWPAPSAKIRRSSFKRPTAMPRRSSSKRSIVCPVLCHSRHQLVHRWQPVWPCLATVVSWESNKKILLMPSLLSTSDRVRRQAKRLSRRDKEQMATEVRLGPSCGFTMPSLVKRCWAAVCCAQRSHLMHTLYGNGPGFNSG